MRMSPLSEGSGHEALTLRRFEAPSKIYQRKLRRPATNVPSCTLNRFSFRSE
jgi:hypothetical protein